MVGLEHLASNRCKIEVYAFHMLQKILLQLHFNFNGSPIDYVTDFIFSGINVGLQS